MVKVVRSRRCKGAERVGSERMVSCCLSIPRVLQEGIHAGKETLNACFWPKSAAAESFSGNLQPS